LCVRRAISKFTLKHRPSGRCFYNRPLENRRPFVQIVDGKCHAGPPEFEIIDAELDGWYYDDEGSASRQTLTQLKAIALELGLPVDQSDELVGAEVEPHTTRDGARNGYSVNIEYCETSP
jgi:hypothetical protein